MNNLKKKNNKNKITINTPDKSLKVFSYLEINSRLVYFWN